MRGAGGKAGFLLVLGLALVAAAFVSVDTGATHLSIGSLFAGDTEDAARAAMARSIILNIRAPRAVMGIATGAALAVAGAILQGLFRNPLADPGLIGVSSGAALAATFAIAFGVSNSLPPFLMAWAVPAAGMAGGFGSTFLLYACGRRQGVLSIESMLLAGIAFSAFCAALMGILIFQADDKALRDITFWTMGSLSGIGWAQVRFIAPFLAGAALCAAAIARTLNALLLGEADAAMMGYPVERAKTLAMLACAASVGTTVSIAGAIGFVGVIVPHLVRLVTGPDYRWVLPGSALLGAVLLEVSDTLSRLIAPPAEVPVGIITALIGAPVFAWLLLKTGRSRGLP